MGGMQTSKGTTWPQNPNFIVPELGHAPPTEASIATPSPRPSGTAPGSLKREALQTPAGTACGTPGREDVQTLAGYGALQLPASNGAPQLPDSRTSISSAPTQTTGDRIDQADQISRPLPPQFPQRLCVFAPPPRAPPVER